MDNFKVIFHINESNKWNILLANVSNLIKDLGNENVTIEVLANGGAVAEYIFADKKSDLLNRIDSMSKLDVTFTACRNSLIGNNIDEKLVPDYVKVVPAGVTELVKKQTEGYAYIKP